MKHCSVCGGEMSRRSFYTCAKCKGIRQTKPKEIRECARPECDKTFALVDKRQKFCSRSCAAQVNNVGKNRWASIVKPIKVIKPKSLITLPSAPKPPRSETSGSSRKHTCSGCGITTWSLSPWCKPCTPEKPFELLGPDTRRRRVLAEQDGNCNRCGISSWLGEPLTLELEHKDGNTENNLRDNLECICPNCHSLTATWRGRNKNGAAKRTTDEQLTHAIITSKNIRSALRSLGMAAKGNNYKRAQRLLALVQSTGEVLPPFALA